MGRKANKKRARAARPPSQAQNTSAGTTTAILSLKGIVSTNNDPYSCHGCSNSLDLRDLMFCSQTSVCCGKMFCCDCAEAGKGPPVVGAACSSCGVTLATKLRVLKARAKEGHPWAQFALAWQLQHESPVEARKLYRKAAEKGGHPFAFARLATFYHHGQPERFKAAKVMEVLEEATKILLSSEFMFDVHLSGCITAIAEIGSNIKDGLKFVQHELLANKGLRGAQYQLALLTSCSKEDLPVALELAREIAVQTGAPRLSPGAPARLAADCCRKLDRTVEGLFWAKHAAIVDEWTKKERAERAHSELCEMRKSCSTCGISLDVSNRKLCAGCKISCYCSRDCQKIHWNRPDDGHRDQCKTVMKMVEEMEKNASKTE